MSETAVVICPGRGTYTKSELGYLRRYHGSKQTFLTGIDQHRKAQSQIPVTDLDAARSYRSSLHATSENASALIYACALGDFQDIDRTAFEIVAVTGNSMGWYLALACAEALAPQSAIQVVNGMGTLMETQGTGGQVLYPVADEEWRPDPDREARIMALAEKAGREPGAQVHVSIRLGGMVVFAANDAGIDALMRGLPAFDRFPMRLAHHAGFHSPLLDHIPAQAKARLPASLFRPPRIPAIDGRGAIWSPHATDTERLHNYTLDHQIRRPYDFSKAVEVAIKEFAPDRLILLGPGTTLGGAVAQVLIRHRWKGLDSKAAFLARQKTDPLILSMGWEEQRARVASQPQTVDHSGRR